MNNHPNPYPPLCHVSSRGRRHFTSLFAAVGIALLGLAASGQAQTKVIAYAVPANTPGTQAFGGALGMDFDVDNPILITRLGVFDADSDGLKLTITARLYDRADLTELISMDFTPEDPGDLVGGSRFKDLPEPIRLEIGFQGTIVAEGYGADEQLNNSGGVPTAVVWTTNDGAGSVKFVGSSRYGDVPGVYPNNVDTGPAARYAAGTFEYQTTPPQFPGKPTVTIKPGDSQITLSWAPVTLPLPATRYQVSRAAEPAGPFTQLAETSETTYTDPGLVNGTVYYYVVRGISATGKVGADSDVKSAAPYVLAADHYVAYLPAAGSLGTQAFGGSLGMDFDLDNPIIVKRLGVFDDNSDGLKLPLAARIFNRETQEMVAELSFTPEDPGTLIEGSRFKPLESPLRLEAGFKGVIEADGYGEGERLLNSGGNTNAITWTLNSGNGSIRYVGTGRFSSTAGAFPETADGGPAARYAAGTFEFEALPPVRPGTPTLSVLLPPENTAATLNWDTILTPMPAVKYQVLRGAAPEGPFTLVAEVTVTTFRDTGLVNGTAVSYVVRAIGAGGEASPDSNVVTVTPAERTAGIAYLNPENQPGNQAFGGSLGMDFDVARPVRITKLGVFDENSDGLFLTLTAAIYDRTTRTELARLVFTPEEPGELVDGSRFKPLPAPLNLAAGFQGSIVAYGYGAGEQLFNTGNQPQNVALLHTFDGASLFFTGTGRWGNAGQYPATADGGPANRYAAGTFYFEPLTEELPALSISLTGGKVKITWTGAGTLQSAPGVSGPYTAVPGATSGMELTPLEAQQYYRIQQ